MLDFETRVTMETAVAPAVAVRGVHFRYPSGRHALEDVTFALRPGEKVALIGPNGAGKSTLLMHLNGILKLQAGSITVMGRGLRPENLDEVRALVGFVFQNPDDQLFSTRVFDDVAFGPLYMGFTEAEVRSRVERALDAVGMGGFEERRPHELSIGERKRIALATVLSMDAQLLVLDEPSAGLDPRARRGLINLLAELPQAMIVSTHDMYLVQELFERVLVMDGGRLQADGPTRHILADTDLLERHGLAN
jgi:cobalt transport protein ATP-binding subunit